MVRTVTAVLLACASVTIAPVAYAAPAGVPDATVNRFPTSWCKTPTPPADVDFSEGFIRPPGRLQGTQPITVTTLYVDFPDAPATDSAQAFQDAYVEPGLDFAGQLSHGRVDITSQAVTQWLRMPQPSTAYDWTEFDGQRAFMAEAIQLADASVDFSTTDAVYIIASQQAAAFDNGYSFAPTPRDGIRADGKLITNGMTLGVLIEPWRAPALSWGLLKAYGLPNLRGGEPHPWAEPFSLNSSIVAPAPELFGWEQWVAGWLPDDQALCLAAGTSTFVLSDVIGNTGTRVAAVPLARDRMVVVESRRRAGVDANGFDGVLAYVVDPRIASEKGPIRLATDANGPVHGLAAGSSLTVAGVRIDVQDAGPDSYTVAVTAASPPTTTPGKVFRLTAQVVGRGARISWTEPLRTGWLPIVRYQYRVGLGPWQDTTQPRFAIPRLPARGSLTVVVRAVNAKGFGSPTALKVSR